MFFVKNKLSSRVPFKTFHYECIELKSIELKSIEWKSIELKSIELKREGSPG